MCVCTFENMRRFVGTDSIGVFLYDINVSRHTTKLLLTIYNRFLLRQRHNFYENKFIYMTAIDRF